MLKFRETLNPFQEESFVKSVTALTLLYDGDISEDIIPAGTGVLVPGGDTDTQLVEDPIVEDPGVEEPSVEDTDPTEQPGPVVESTREEAGDGRQNVLSVSGESSEQKQQLSDQVSIFNDGSLFLSPFF